MRVGVGNPGAGSIGPAVASRALPGAAAGAGAAALVRRGFGSGSFRCGLLLLATGER